MHTYLRRYAHIAGYTLITQLIISGMQWPILMAWGLPMHPIAIIGNMLFMPVLCVLIFALTCVFLCYLIYIPTWPILWIVRYILDLWLACLYLPLYDVTLRFPCPHWSVLCGIPILTGIIAYYPRTIPRKIIWLSIFLSITGYGLRNLHQQPTRIDLDANLSVYARQTMRVLYYHGQHAARYTRSWIQYQCIPHLRTYYGTEQMTMCLYYHRMPRHLSRMLHENGVWNGKAISLQHVITRILQRNREAMNRSYQV